MILDLLHQLERRPETTFSERELVARDAEAFERLKARKLLRVLLTDDVATRQFGDRLLTVVRDSNGRPEGFDAEDHEFEPVLLDEIDVRLWRVDIHKLASDVAASYPFLLGRAEVMHSRLAFLGKTTGGAAVVLMLLAGDRTAAETVAALPSLLAPDIRSYVVVTPSYRPPQALARHCQSSGQRSPVKARASSHRSNA